MNTKPIVIVLAVVVLLIIGYLVFGGSPASAPSETATTTVTGAEVVDVSGAPIVTTTTTTTETAVTITYGPNGFSPANVTVAPGTTVTWVNSGSGRMWVASDVHPSHTEFDGTSLSQHCANGAPTSKAVFDACGPVSSFSFTFTKAGTWEYHNHAQASDHGTITVR
jgi:plastocyanin